MSIHILTSMFPNGFNPEVTKVFQQVITDRKQFAFVASEFEKMHEKTKGNILIISHQERILDIADKIVVIANGKIAAYGTKDEIMPELLSAQAACKFASGGEE